MSRHRSALAGSCAIETTAPVTQLNDQTVELASLIGQFRVGEAPIGGSNPVRDLRRRAQAAVAGC